MPEDAEDEYELLPHREIQELKEELSKLKDFEVAPSKRLHVSLLELNTKLEKLLTIFEDASHEMRAEEGGLGFTEKMKPLLEKMNKILDQNAEIASGILALADMVKERSQEMRPIEEDVLPEPPMPPTPPRTMQGMMAHQLPPMPPGVPPGPPMPPMPPRRRTFGL